MKTAMTVTLAALYTLGAVATYNSDRRLGEAQCWKTPFNNTASSSAMTAAWWPVYGALVGYLLVMSGDPGPYGCRHR